MFALLKGHERKVAPGEEPTFTWFRAGQEFDPEDRFKVKRIETLIGPRKNGLTKAIKGSLPAVSSKNYDSFTPLK